MKTIYLVWGSTGEYSDHREWFVCFYKDEKSAQNHVELADKEAKKIIVEQGDDYTKEYAKNLYDPDMQINSTGVNYAVSEVEIGWIKK